MSLYVNQLVKSMNWRKKVRSQGVCCLFQISRVNPFIPTGKGRQWTVMNVPLYCPLHQMFQFHAPLPWGYSKSYILSFPFGDLLLQIHFKLFTYLNFILPTFRFSNQFHLIICLITDLVWKMCFCKIPELRTDRVSSSICLKGGLKSTLLTGNILFSENR